MGLFDTINFTDRKGQKVGIQIKSTKGVLDEYEIGDTIDLEDGIYLEKEGNFVVFDGRIVAAFTFEERHCYNQFGEKIYLND